jgi:uncharacterized membrane protein
MGYISDQTSPGTAFPNHDHERSADDERHDAHRHDAHNGFHEPDAASRGTALRDTTRGAQYHPRYARKQGEGLATFLGLFSVGLGLAQIAAPDAMTRLVGGRPTRRMRNTMRGLGVRELTNGLAILQQPRSPVWMWSRVAGDTLDLALLGTLYSDDRNDRGRTAAATAAVLGVTALDYLCAEQLATSSRSTPMHAEQGPAHDAGISPSMARRVARSATVNRSRQEVYAFWRNFENLPQFMRHLESVQVLDERRSQWTATAPAGSTVSWEAELLEDVPGERISWRSLPGSTIANAGTVRFQDAPGDRGTEVHVELEYRPPAGMLGAAVAMLFREEPKEQLIDDLRAFKQVLEVGEVLVSDATRRRGPHPAKPAHHNTERAR